MGLLAAVERYLKLDHAARAQFCEDSVRMWCAALNAARPVSLPNAPSQTKPVNRCPGAW